ncbi:hypothetical protein [Spiroplasma endosymbiont of Dactylopius coccus]
MINHKSCMVCNEKFTIKTIDSALYLSHCSGKCYEKTLEKYK